MGRTQTGMSPFLPELKGSQPSAFSRMARHLCSLAKGGMAVLCAGGALLATACIPVAFSDRELATIGRVHHCGLPLPWRAVAPGLAWPVISWWALSINLAFWTLVSCLLFRVRTWKGRALCLALAEVVLGVGFLSAFRTGP